MLFQQSNTSLAHVSTQRDFFKLHSNIVWIGDRSLNKLNLHEGERLKEPGGDDDDDVVSSIRKMKIQLKTGRIIEMYLS